MGPSELLSFVTSVFERLEIPYFVTGSVATTVYGEPRLTNDLDLVVRLNPEQVAGFCREFQPPRFLLFRTGDCGIGPNADDVPCDPRRIRIQN